MYIRKFERGLVFKRGEFIEYLMPGKVRGWFRPGVTVELVDVRTLFTPEDGMALYLDNQELMAEMQVLEVRDGQIALHFIDGRLQQVLAPGTYGYWDAVVNQEFRLFDRAEVEIGPELQPAILEDARLRPYVAAFQVASYEKGLFIVDGVFKRLLEPGGYRFWSGVRKVQVFVVDMRTQQLDVTGQEVMTRDKVALRLNFAVQYRVVDAVKVGTEVKDYEKQVYMLLQLILRDYLGALTLDELLARKENVNRFALEGLRERASNLGLEFSFAGVKDVILPGETREILNLVLTAEKRAQANVVMRREETASTRSLLNTARMMDDNSTLYRLKELEFLERVSEKIGTISLSGGGGLLDRLSEILARTGSARAGSDES